MVPNAYSKSFHSAAHDVLQFSQPSAMMREICKYAYGFTLETSKKCFLQEVATEMLKLLFSIQLWPLMEINYTEIS